MLGGRKRCDRSPEHPFISVRKAVDALPDRQVRRRRCGKRHVEQGSDVMLLNQVIGQGRLPSASLCIIRRQRSRLDVRLGWIFWVKSGGRLDTASVEDQFGIQSTYLSMVLVQSKQARQPRYSWCHSAGGIAAA